MVSLFFIVTGPPFLVRINPITRRALQYVSVRTVQQDDRDDPSSAKLARLKVGNDLIDIKPWILVNRIMPRLLPGTGRQSIFWCGPVAPLCRYTPKRGRWEVAKHPMRPATVLMARLYVEMGLTGAGMSGEFVSGIMKDRVV